MSCFRLYNDAERGPDGYPPEWHRLPKETVAGLASFASLLGDRPVGIKDVVRLTNGWRCARCLHPYTGGRAVTSPRGEWSRCDERCAHAGPFRAWSEYGDPISLEHEAADALALLRCGDASRVEAQWRILTVHHLDGNKANCRWWNLAPLCQRCHLQIQGKVQMKRVWPWEHSDWFKPYVAGFYAWSYLGEDLERPEVEARLDELLDLELAA